MVAVAGGNLLAAISPQSCDWLARLGRRQKYLDGELVHSRGDRNANMGIVISGAIKIGRLESGGTSTFVSEIRAGQHYADVLMLGAARRTHDAVAVGATVIDHFDAIAFGQILEQPEIVRALYAITAARLTGTMVMNDDLRSLPREVHLAKILLHQLRQSGDGDRVPCLQEELATLLGISGMTLSKSLNLLRREGLIETGYRQIVVPDRERLRRWIAARQSA
jgi:CRP/FNR family transcriptional regulator, cyclic AMP receptor protein